MVLGMTIFLLFPFSRLVHVWSGFASGLPVPPDQIVRSRRLNVPAGHNQPGAVKQEAPMRHASSQWHVNGVPLEPPATLTDEDLRQRACSELLRQAAHRTGCSLRTTRRR